jgi:hypothetical protein
VKLSSRLSWLGIICIVVGVSLIVSGFFLSDTTSKHHNSFLAYLATNLGGLLAFAASYTLISEAFLRRDFAKEMYGAIDEKLRHAKNDQSIAHSGLFEIIPAFSSAALHERMKRAQTVKMIVVKNTAYFREYRDSIRDRISEGKLNLEVVIADPKDLGLINVIFRRYDEFSEGPQLSESICTCVNIWLKEKIFDGLPDNCKDKFLLYLSQHSLLYSAYLFDREELWYIPYHCRKGRQGIPVLVYRGVSDELPIYRDVLHVFQSAQRFDLANKLESHPSIT